MVNFVFSTSHSIIKKVGKLGNEGFVSKAPAEVVDAEKAKLAELEGQLTAMMEQLKAL
ncbi:hypothetical protein AAJP47_03450 [Psychrobacter sp. B38]|uniref:hypothetical protein n=1 Tax=Psychrobacter sp. B38 TaxID=3143538 RepID=UPI00320F410A